ncbi:hypothetical protein D1872_221370 [compost metagenome]
MRVHHIRQHRHRIRIIEEPGIGAYLLNIPGKVKHDRNRAQVAEDPADAQRVANRLTQSVFFRHFKIGDRTRVIPADLNGVNDVFGAAQRRFAVAVGLDGAAAPQRCRHAVKQTFRVAQALGVNIEQRKLEPLQRFRQHHIPQHIFDEYRTSRS